MGGLCCCPRPEDFEEYTSYPNGAMYQNCFCLRCCVRWCLRMYTSWFDPGEGRDSSSSIQGVPGSAAAGLLGDGGSEVLTQMQSWNGSTDNFDEQTESGKRPPAKGMGRNESILSLTDDEDICPTCLDGYTEENPKINTECQHHFHLGCIYEWMERSKHCPVCDKEMVFSESI